MVFTYDNKNYEVVIDKKKTNRNTYIRVKKDLVIYVTTNIFTRDRDIQRLLDENYQSVVKMIKNQYQKNESNEGFHYLGRKYDIIYVDGLAFSLGDEKVLMNKSFDVDTWYKKQAKRIFKQHLDTVYHEYSRKIPYPGLRIRKMTSRWGVCNTKLKVITLNLELIKRDLKYLDYVIVHELSHLLEGNHSSRFWSLVEENCPNYKEIKKEMRLF
ncbi:MAG: M48 family metallopeptidase [Bacilli bacterium]|nr:M48 family metallopeptidase [Bacilli bacterium]